MTDTRALYWIRTDRTTGWDVYCTHCGTHLASGHRDLDHAVGLAEHLARVLPCCDQWSTTKTKNPTATTTSVTRPASSPSSRWSPSAPSPAGSPSGSSSTGSKADYEGDTP